MAMFLRAFAYPVRKTKNFVKPISSYISGKNSVKIKWKSAKDSPVTEYHYVWLRDNCPCSQCYTPLNTQRLVDPLILSSDIQPMAVSQQNDQYLTIVWPDGHQSKYPADWLKDNAYDGSIVMSHDKRVPFTRDTRLDPVTWDKTIASDPPRVIYQSVMESDEEFLKWNSFMEIHGFCFIEKTPLDFEAMKKLFDRIGLVRNTLWGDFYVLGKGKNSTGANNAYADPTYFTTSIPVPPHLDGSYLLKELPCLQLFQVLSFNGKELPVNILTDGFKLAEIVRQQSEHHYQLLAHVPIPFQYEDDERKHYSSHCMLDVEPYTGRLLGVRYCNSRRMITNCHCHYKLKEFDPKATMADFYEAMHMFNRALHSERVGYRFQLEVGTALLTDNYRVLHARTAHEGERELRGGYINLEDWRGKVMAARDRLAAAET